MISHQVQVDTETCIGCGMCAKVCVANNIKIENKKAQTIIKDCVLCGQCAAICPKKAITISGYSTDPVEQENNVQLCPEDVLDVIRFRRTIRNFKQDEIPNEVLNQILEAGRLTHTAKNLQDVSFVVLKQERARIEQMAVQLFRRLKPLINITSPLARINPIHDHFFFFHAPIVIVILAKEKTNGLLAAQNMEFVAEANGLGVLYSGYFTIAANVSRNIKNALKVPKGKKVAMTLVLGYPDVKFLRSAQRKELDVTYL